MTTSGTYNFATNLQVAQVITESFERIGIFGEQVSGDMMTSALNTLNYMFMSWRADGSIQYTIKLEVVALPVNIATFTTPLGTYDIINMSIRQSNIDIGMAQISREEYLYISNKTAPGKPVNYFVDKSVSPPVVYMYPVPNTDQFTIRYNSLQIEQDINNPSNTTGITPWWADAMASGLTARLAEKFKPEMYQEKKMLADMEFVKARRADSDKTSVRIRTPYRFG